jgi:hypothetical protein
MTSYILLLFIKYWRNRGFLRSARSQTNFSGPLLNLWLN